MAAHLLQVAECMTKALVGTDEQKIATYEKAKGLWDGAYGKGQHVLTARCLVGIGNRYNVLKQNNGLEDFPRALEYGREALAVVASAGKGGGVEEEGALALIGDAHYELKQWDEALEHYQRRVRVLLEHYGGQEGGGKKEARLADAYLWVGNVYMDGKGDHERALEEYMKAVPVAEAATGKLSGTTGRLCQSIAAAHVKQQRYAEAVSWQEKAVAAYTFTYGAENEQFTKTAMKDLGIVTREAAKQK